MDTAQDAIAAEPEREHELMDASSQDTYGNDIERVGCICGGWLYDANADSDVIAAAFTAHLRG